MQHIRLDDIIKNENQPRKTFYDGSLEELAQSIRERGVLEPIIVRPKNGKYELVMGERRFRASRLAGLVEIPAVVREMSDEEVASDALLENFQREDLNPIDRAKAIEGLLNFMTWEKCSKTLGVSVTTIRRHLELLELPGVIQQALVESWDKTSGSSFTEAHARALKQLNGDMGMQRRLVEKIKAENLSVSDTQKILEAIRQAPAKKEAILRVPLKVTEELLRQLCKAQKKRRPFKPQTGEHHLAAFDKAANQLSDLIDERIFDYINGTQMNQLLSTSSTLLSELDKFTRSLRSYLKKGDDGFREIYIHCPLCGRIELIGSLKCSVCWSILRRCTDCGHYDRVYQRCSFTQETIYQSDAESPKENSKSYKCTDYKPRFEAAKAA